MTRRAAVIVLMCTVLAVCLAFATNTFRVSHVKFFIFIAGVCLLAIVVTWETLFGRRRFLAAFAGRTARFAVPAVLVLLLLSIASISWAEFRLAAVFRASETVLYVAWAILVIAAIRTRRDISNVMHLFVIVGVVAALMSFGFYRLHLDEGVLKPFFLPSGNPNWLAACLLIPMMLCVEGLLRNLAAQPRRIWSIVLFAPAFALMATVVVMTESESAMVSFVFALAVLPVLLRAKRRWMTSAAIAGVIILVCAADLVLGKPGYIRKFADSKSVAIRLDMWRWGTTLAKRNPVSGLGAGAYFPSVGEISSIDRGRKPGYYSDINVHVHNEPLEILIELGVLGLAAFLWPVGLVLRNVSRLPRDGPADVLRTRLAAFAAGWLAIFLQSLLTVGMRFWSVPVIFWTGLGLLVAALRYFERGEETPAPADAKVEGTLPLPPGLQAVPSLGRGEGVLPESPLTLTLSRGEREHVSHIEGTSNASSTSRRYSEYSSRAGRVVKLTLVSVLLLGGGSAVIFHGYRASIAMVHTEKEKDRTRLIELLETASKNSVFFVDRVRALKVLGSTYAEEKKWGRADDCLREVTHLAGHLGDTAVILADVYVMRGMIGEAVSLIREYGRLCPTDVKAGEFFPKHFKDVGNKDIKLNLDYSKVMIGVGLIRLRDGKENEATAFFVQALKANPEDPHAMYLFAMQGLKEKNPEISKVYILLGKSYELGLRVPGQLVELARLEEARGNPERAAELIEESQRLFPKANKVDEELEKDGSGNTGDSR